jgi:hypothetical protein
MRSRFGFDDAVAVRINLEDVSRQSGMCGVRRVNHDRVELVLLRSGDYLYVAVRCAGTAEALNVPAVGRYPIRGQ